MKMAKITITMIVDDDTPEHELNTLCNKVEDFTCELRILCKDFDISNPTISTKLED